MHVVGIVAEYNPFHTGHRYQLQESRRILGENTLVVAVMSGNWVQQADCAIADKWTRAHMALLGGVDLVLELPTVWATSSAEGFAKGATALLAASGVVDVISFGSECGDVQALNEIARCLDSDRYQEELRRMVDRGAPFPACRQAAVGLLLGDSCGALLSSPNNNLGVEYIRALNALGSSIRPISIQRCGYRHDGSGLVQPTLSSPQAAPHFLSATQIRAYLQENRWESAEPYLLSGGLQLLEHNTGSLASLHRAHRAILAKFRTMSLKDWAALPDSAAAEGLPQRLERAGRQCTTVEEFYLLAHTKRYTYSRLKRLVLRSYLGISPDDIPASPPYLRVLGFSKKGRILLQAMKTQAELPILTKPAHAKMLDKPGRRLFQLEARCTDLYDLCLDPVPVPNREWTTGPVVLED